mmetsp:Transcript_14586/g.25827  ORF Transcript_14586/g.25827 Transcript_14586/m.25827 type:complete len:196 (-) Transcript_14586:28-615(-)
MFQEQLSECRSLAAQARDEVKKLRAAATQERSALSNSAFSILKEADENLRSLQKEARSAPSNERQELTRAQEALRAELQSVADELKAADREFLLGGSSNGRASGGDRTDRLFLTQEERRRASAVTENMGKQNERLQQAKREAADAEAIGTDTLKELYRQREKIGSIRGNVDEISVNNREAGKAVKSLEQGNCAVM